MSRHVMLVLVVVLTIALGCASPRRVQTADMPAPLFNDLGGHECSISTDSPLAQRYFNQGLILAYGFNHMEAARAFAAASTVDPDCAMGHWGVALVHGPNINRPMTAEDAAKAWDALQKAQALADRATDKERALIDALSKRYAADPPQDRGPLDQAYADAMRDVAQRFPDDADVQTLFAEAVMDTMPWDYWSPDLSAKPATAQAKAALERAMQIDPDHPGAHHLYIHMVEAGPDPSAGEPSADRLRDLVPGAGHLVHMPAHIYVRVGRYHEAIEVNHRAAEADESYIWQCNAQGFYPVAYYPHNLHFTWYAAMLSGEGGECIAAAKKIVHHASDEWVEAQRMYPTLAFAYVRFGKWDEVLAMPQPTDDMVFATAMWRFAQSIALIRRGRLEAAAPHVDQLTALTASDAGKAFEQPGFFGHSQLQIATHLARGELARARGAHDDALEHLRAAVAVEDALPYMEPPFWPFPTRHMLGAALLAMDRAAEAEAVYRQDLKKHPENGWALRGLADALAEQGKTDAAADAGARFKTAWRHSDTPIKASAF